MKSLKSQAQNKDVMFVVGLQHEKTITLGYRATSENELNVLYDGFEVYKCSRGGLATLHDLGQLVIYPVIDLKHHQISPRAFIKALNLATVETFKEFNIKATYDECNGGVWTTKGKISFTGLRIENGVTQHGISINLRNNLNDFNQIKICGTQTVALDSLNNYISDFEINNIFTRWQKHFELPRGYAVPNPVPNPGHAALSL